MSVYLGDFPVNGKVFFHWNTNAQSGASITRATDGTLKLYKGNMTAATWIVERTSLNGVTQTEDFDGNTGVHAVAIDLSDNTDAGFYAAGSEIQAVYNAMTIDGQAVSAEVASFSIERAGGVLALVKAGLTLTAAERDAVADAHLDRANAVETGVTPRQALRVALAADAGKTSGMDTGTVKVRNVADSKDRISATTDASGNRTAVTLDLT